MGNSSLATYRRISPSRTSPRNHEIDTITIHCTAGQCTAQECADFLSNGSRQASANYCVGKDGSIAVSVDENDRSWCSSNAENDNRAITIEVSSDSTEPYSVTTEAYAALIKLLVDICERNHIDKLVWSEDKNSRVNHVNGCNMTVHRDYAAKACPGTYLYENMWEIATAVNHYLGVYTPKQDVVNPPVYTVQVGAFTNKDNAYKLRDVLKALGYNDVFVQTK